MSAKSPSFWEGVDAYWFDRRSPAALGLFRIVFGLGICLSLYLTATSYRSWFTENGYVPAWMADAFLGGPVMVGNLPIPRLDLLAQTTHPGAALALYIATCVAAVLTTLGLWTQVAKFALAIGIVSLHHRNPWILHGGDTVLRVMVIYLAVSPCGMACSLDRLWGLARGRIAPGPVVASLWSQRLITFNIAIIYFTTVWLKYFGETWRDGTATFYTPRLEEFQRFPVPPFMNEFPMVTITTYGTLIVEFALATLVFWKPARKWVLLSGLALHAYIEYSMNVPTFALLICSAYICFYDGEEVSAWAKRLGERLTRWQTAITAPLGSPGAAAAQAADALSLVRWSEGPTEPAAGVKLWSRTPWLFFVPPGVWLRLMRQGEESR